MLSIKRSLVACWKSKEKSHKQTDIGLCAAMPVTQPSVLAFIMSGLFFGLPKRLMLCVIILQWRIQDFPQGGVDFHKICMSKRKNRDPCGVRPPDPPMSCFVMCIKIEYFVACSLQHAAYRKSVILNVWRHWAVNQFLSFSI